MFLRRSPSKVKKSKAFKFASKSKDKREKTREKDKSDKELKEKDKEAACDSKEKKKDKDKKDKDKKEKSKEKDKEKVKEKDKDKKDKKMKQTSLSEEILELGGMSSNGYSMFSHSNIEYSVSSDAHPIFGVSLGLAVVRSHCHDNINLPLVVRDCIDYLQEHGLHSEQMYKVDPVKTKLQNLKKLYNNREANGLDEFDVPTACGLLKLFIK